LLLQKFPAPSFTVSTKIKVYPDLPNEKSGLVVMGRQWAFLALTNTAEGMQLGMYTGSYFQGFDKTELVASVPLSDNTCYLRVQVDKNAQCQFFYSTSDQQYEQIGSEFKAAAGMWIGAKVGLFSINPNMQESSGYADVDWFRFQ
jgi:beta-xylosidase